MTSFPHTSQNTSKTYKGLNKHPKHDKGYMPTVKVKNATCNSVALPSVDNFIDKSHRWGIIIKGAIPSTMKKIITLLLILHFFLTPVSAPYTIYERKEEVKQEIKKDVKQTSKEYIVGKIKETFPEQTKVMLAIAIEESRLDPNAKGYNCYYKLSSTGEYDNLIRRKIDITFVYKKRESNQIVSTYCRKGHEKYAWSTDGGLYQVNNAKNLDLEHNLIQARQKYDTQGLSAWVSYTSGRYKKHLATAEKLLD